MERPVVLVQFLLLSIDLQPDPLALSVRLFVGAVLGGSPGHYLENLLPGNMVMSVFIVTMYGGARLANDITTGVFDRFRSLAVWRGASIVGGLLSDAGRYLLPAAIVVGLGVAIGYRPHGGALDVIAADALVVVFALLVLDSITVMGIANVVLFPLTFASNIFVPADTMPGWLRAFVQVNPLSHLATAGRALMNITGGAGGPVVWSLSSRLSP